MALKDRLIEKFREKAPKCAFSDIQISLLLDAYFLGESLEQKANKVSMKKVEWLVWLHLHEDVKKFLYEIANTSVELLEDEIYRLCETHPEDEHVDPFGNPIWNPIRVKRDKMKIDYLMKKIEKLQKEEITDRTINFTIREL